MLVHQLWSHSSLHHSVRGRHSRTYISQRLSVLRAIMVCPYVANSETTFWKTHWQTFAYINIIVVIYYISGSRNGLTNHEGYKSKSKVLHLNYHSASDSSMHGKKLEIFGTVLNSSRRIYWYVCFVVSFYTITITSFLLVVFCMSKIKLKMIAYFSARTSHISAYEILRTVQVKCTRFRRYLNVSFYQDLRLGIQVDEL